MNLFLQNRRDLQTYRKQTNGCQKQWGWGGSRDNLEFGINRCNYSLYKNKQQGPIIT